MSLKKYSRLIIVAIILIFIVTAVAVINSNTNTDNVSKNSKNIKVNLYFIDTASSTLKAEERIISIEDNSESENAQITSKVLEELKLGPKTQIYKASIPSNVNILSAELGKIIDETNVETKTVSVNLSSEYNDLKASDALFCRVALVYTLTDLNFIDSVKTLADGEELHKANGEVLGYEKKEDIVMGDIINPEPVTTEIVKLYFANEDATDLVVEEREIEFNPNQSNPNSSKAKYIMEQLIVGPKDSKFSATVPSQTKIKDIKIREGICYVDLSKEFVEQHQGGTMGEWLTIESIVNSLTEISEIKKVQFLIEGEKQQEYKGHIDISKPLERTVDDTK